MSEEISLPSSEKGFNHFFRRAARKEGHSASKDEGDSNKDSAGISIGGPPGTKSVAQSSDTLAQSSSSECLFFQKRSMPLSDLAPCKASGTTAGTSRIARQAALEPAWPDKILFQGGHIGAECPRPNPPRQQQQQQRSHCQRSSSCIQDIIAAEGDRVFSSFALHHAPAHTRKRRRQSSDSDAILTTNAEIQAFMRATYPLHIDSMACKTLLSSFLSGSVANKGRSKTSLWTDKYRPDHVEALLGNRQDTLYLRDWLLQMKVMSPAAMEQMRIEEAHHRKKKKRDLFENIPIDDDADDDFMPSSRPRVRPKLVSAEKMHSNLLLIVGDNGIGKTAAVYTAAEEVGYQVFEIHPGVKRAGKDLIASVGEMTESHLVTFECGGKGESKKRKRDGTNSSNSSNSMSANLLRQFTIPKKQDPSSHQHERDQHPNSTTDHQPKQSLILLEEVDVLYEDDKGFWPAVTELSQKSKRPIVMTCNDISLVPLDQLFLQAILMFEPPSEQEMLAYLQLICLNEGYFVHPADLAGLFALIGDDLRQMITTLQFWCDGGERREDDSLCGKKRKLCIAPRLFESCTTISDLCRRESLVRLSQLQQSSLKTGIDLLEFYDNYNPPVSDHPGSSDQDSLSDILSALDTAVLDDHLQESEEHNVDMHGPQIADRLVGHKLLWKESADSYCPMFDSDLSSRIWLANYEQLHSKEWLRMSVWDQLVENRQVVFRKLPCLYAKYNLSKGPISQA
ncbi:hypothetical protein BX666DRAFT_1957052 [Dichotomocladium elegans]|nr:hypothetical protein BX666DRAFT_1957052 [Dichotomocladium elegans]